MDGLQTHPGGSRRVPGRLLVDRADGLLQLVVVEQGLGEPADGVDTLVVVQAVPGQGLP